MEVCQYLIQATKSAEKGIAFRARRIKTPDIYCSFRGAREEHLDGFLRRSEAVVWLNAMNTAEALVQLPAGREADKLRHISCIRQVIEHFIFVQLPLEARY